MNDNITFRSCIITLFILLDDREIKLRRSWLDHWYYDKSFNILRKSMRFIFECLKIIKIRLKKRNNLYSFINNNVFKLIIDRAIKFFDLNVTRWLTSIRSLIIYMYLSFFYFELIDRTIMMIQYKFKISIFEYLYKKIDKTEMRKIFV